MPHFRIACVALTTSLFALPSLAAEGPTHLILRLWGKDTKLLVTRIQTAAQAVGPQGKVILDYMGSERTEPVVNGGEKLEIAPRDLLAKIPAPLRSRLLWVNSNESYSWPRDTAYGWSSPGKDRYRLHGRRDGNKMTDQDGKSFTSFSSLGIAALLSACEGSEFEVSAQGKASLQGGEIINNGQGLCIANAEVEKMVTDAGELDLLGERLGCWEMIYGPSYNDLRALGLMNGHLDLSAAFIGPRTVMIPALDDDCSVNATEQAKFRELWAGFKRTLMANNLDVLEVPIGGGCIGQTATAAGKPGSRFARSYSNVILLEDAIILPEFASAAETTPEEIRKLRAHDELARSLVKRLMTQKKIPTRQILGMPIRQDAVESGAEARCMSLEVPGRLGRCTQARLDRSLEARLTRASTETARLTKGASPEACRTSRDLYYSLRFLQDETARQRVLTTPDGATLQIPQSFREKSLPLTERLQNALKECKS